MQTMVENTDNSNQQNGDQDNKKGTKIEEAASYKTLEQEIKEVLHLIQNNTQENSVQDNNYLRAAKLYLCQGKSQDAISILKQGLSTDPQPETSSRLLLKQQLEAAQTQHERRVNFIRYCPYEIVHNIINRIDLATAVQCLDVGPSWRYKFLNHEQLWKTFTPDIPGKQRKLTELMRVIAKYVETMNMYNHPARLKRHFGLLKTINFCNLKSLCICDEGTGVMDPEINLVKLLYNVLPRVSSTLTCLDITFNTQKFSKISLVRLLSICRNLKSIKLDVHELEKEADSESLSRLDLNQVAPFESLERLQVTFRPAKLWTTWTIFEEIFPFTPRLKSFIVSHYRSPLPTFMGGSNMLYLLREGILCPELEEFEMYLLNRTTGEKELLLADNDQDDDDITRLEQQRDNRNNMLLTGDDNVTTPSVIAAHDKHENHNLQANSNNENIGCKGLRRLVVYDLYSIGPYLQARLEKSYDTLRTLSLVLAFNSEVLNRESWFSTTTFRNLSVFSLAGGCSSIYSGRLPEILQHLPALESLYLGNSDMHDDSADSNNLVNAIIQKNKLTRLGFERFNVFSPHHKFFEILLARYADIAQQNLRRCPTVTTDIHYGLKSLQIVDCPYFTGAALRHASKIKTLQRCSILLLPQDKEETPILLNDDIDEFTRELLIRNSAEIPVLSKLKLGNIILPDQSVENIIACKSLKSLMVDPIQGTSREGEQRLINHIERMAIF